MNTTTQSRVTMIMQRTMCNLEYIDRHQTKVGPYEVTQLVNSFLGALCHPWEDLRIEFKGISIADAETQGWPRVTKEYPEDQDPKNLGDLLRLMRNGMAHGNITFLPEGDCEIERIRIVNIDPKCGHRTWGTVLTTHDLRLFLNKFVATAKTLSAT